MTVTVPVTGHADFQADMPWRSQNLFPDITHVYPTGVTQGTIYPTAGFSSLLLRFAFTVGAGIVTVNWFDDAAGATGVGSDSWNVSTSTSLLAIIPVEGTFVRIDFNNTTGGNDTATNHASLTQLPAREITYPVSGSFAGNTALAVGASATVNDSPLFITKGHGHLRLNPADNLGKLNATLRIVDESGNVLANLYQNNGFTGLAEFDFPYPDRRVRLAITNTDAAGPHTLDYALWCDNS